MAHRINKPAGDSAVSIYENEKKMAFMRLICLLE